MRGALIGLAVFVACSPFGGSGDDDDAPASTPPNDNKADASIKPNDAGGTGSTEGGATIEPVDDAGRKPVEPPPCAQALVTSKVDFEQSMDAAGWSALGSVPISPTSFATGASLAKNNLGHFESTTDEETSDTSTLRISSVIAARPLWARVEWDAAVLEAAPYAAVGCTLGLVLSTANERGRAYFATEQPGGADKGLFPSLDSWWAGSKEAVKIPAPGYAPGTWQHYALEVDFGAFNVTVKGFINGDAIGELANKAWSPSVDGITSSCGALYQKSPGGTITTKLEMDNIVLWVCPVP